MDCYRLAKFYSRNPAEFLAMSLSEIIRHKDYTARLIKETQPDDDG